MRELSVLELAGVSGGFNPFHNPTADPTLPGMGFDQGTESEGGDEVRLGTVAVTASASESSSGAFSPYYCDGYADVSNFLVNYGAVIAGFSGAWILFSGPPDPTDVVAAGVGTFGVIVAGVGGLGNILHQIGPCGQIG